MQPLKTPATVTTARNTTPNQFEPVSLRGYEIAMFVLTGLVCLVAGSVLTLRFLRQGTPDLVLWLVLLGILATIGILLLRQRVRARQSAALDAWNARAKNERATLQNALDEQTQLVTAQRAEMQTLQEKIAQLEQREMQLAVPVISGWQYLGANENEIAPQLAIFAELFRGQHQVVIQEKLNGGHRNFGVYRTRSSAEADRIVKIARSADIRAETRAQELFNRFSQNNGGQFVREVHHAQDDAQGGIVYRLAALRHNAQLQTLARFYRDTENASDCAALVTQLYAETLPHSQFRASRDADLIELYALPDHILARVEKTLHEIPLPSGTAHDTETLYLHFGDQEFYLRNPLYFAKNVLPQYSARQTAIVCGVIHGDLHSENILLEMPEQKLWVIDFAKTRADAHTLADYARLETDLKFCLLRDTAAQNYFAQAARFEEMLLAPRAKEELAITRAALDAYNAEFQKAGACIAALRQVAVRHQRETEDAITGHFIGESVLPYYFALWHATMRALSYAQSSPAQKMYAFVSAAMLCERMAQELS